MDMRCSVYLRHSPERQAYIDGKIGELFVYYGVKDEDKGHFLAEPNVRCMIRTLKSINLSVHDIVSYFGDAFASSRRWETEGGRYV